MIYYKDSGGNWHSKSRNDSKEYTVTPSNYTNTLTAVQHGNSNTPRTEAVSSIKLYGPDGNVVITHSLTVPMFPTYLI
ncbi:hypothetical protein FACS189425_01060 [Clostridia bacterium]|nr:hypothetical protein FACS189425_01060 [Clostridia bacterium]